MIKMFRAQIWRNGNGLMRANIMTIHVSLVLILFLFSICFQLFIDAGKADERISSIQIPKEGWVDDGKQTHLIKNVIVEKPKSGYVTNQSKVIYKINFKKNINTGILIDLKVYYPTNNNKFENLKVLKSFIEKRYLEKESKQHLKEIELSLNDLNQIDNPAPYGMLLNVLTLRTPSSTEESSSEKLDEIQFYGPNVKVNIGSQYPDCDGENLKTFRAIIRASEPVNINLVSGNNEYSKYYDYDKYNGGYQTLSWIDIKEYLGNVPCDWTNQEYELGLTPGKPD